MKIQVNKKLPVVKPLAVYTKPVRKRNRRIGTNLINASQIRNLALNFSRSLRAGKYTEVSRQFLVECNRVVAEHVERKVKSAGPGKTL